jgi:hypothetical protein
MREMQHSRANASPTEPQCRFPMGAGLPLLVHRDSERRRQQGAVHHLGSDSHTSAHKH